MKNRINGVEVDDLDELKMKSFFKKPTNDELSRFRTKLNAETDAMLEKADKDLAIQVSKLTDNQKSIFEKALSNQVQLKDVLPKNSMGGVKDDGAKLLWSLLPWDALVGIVMVLMIGAKKYGAENWRKVDRERYVDAALRHLTAFLMGEVNDPESGMPHLLHLGCCVLFLIVLYGDEPYEHKSTPQKQ